jgi:hypothetical protein
LPNDFNTGRSSHLNAVRRSRRLLAATAVVAGVLAAPAVASTSSVSYSLSGTASSMPGGCLDCVDPTMNATGTASCSVCLPGKPASGSFTIDLGVQTFPPNPCKVKSVSGTIDVTWGDGTTSTATVTGKLHDSKALDLAAAFDATDPSFASDPLTVLLDNFPPNPCLAATQPDHRHAPDRAGVANGHDNETGRARTAASRGHR